MIVHDTNQSYIRKGWPYVGLGLEDLFYKYGVDMEIWAHEHSYERLWPVYNATVHNGTMDMNNPYYNAGAPIHLITGSAGCKENLDNFRPPLPWSAKRIVEYGYTKLTIINRTHLQIQQISDDQNGEIVDSFSIIKTNDLPQWLIEK
ncbi:hypothetical protein BLA29_002347 [Euroglyphus maynei]|uniref:Purple acid phosphatase C-terminal domain-containing protein n=1 Tax=Euroglyphus maynei TaxID=6958 RepID=A0A1Y3B5K7_EURMA|nr:hypothetical protein BLA29_002347 [Euroglyphus maynei]